MQLHKLVSCAQIIDTAPSCAADLKVMRAQSHEQQAAAEEQAGQLERALAEAHLAGEEALLRLKETCAATERQLQVRRDCSDLCCHRAPAAGQKGLQ